jgi:hypothetical protein
LSGGLAHKLRTAGRLGPADLSLIAQAWLALLWADISVSLLPYAWWRGRLRRATSGEPGSAESLDRALFQAFGIALRNHIRPMNCLRRGLALHRLLVRRGVASRLVIGVRRPEDRLEAHAWIESAGRVLGDRPDVATLYTPLAPGEEGSAAVLPFD